ncbi:hypothetical protein STEG23_031413 [Scotinomys teguina]
MGQSGAISSALNLELTEKGARCQQCSEGRTYSNAIISPNLETIRIMRASQTFSVGDCTAACCDLPSCDLAWWFEGSCYLVNCKRQENCEPRTTGPIRSYLTFVHRPVQKPEQLLDYGDMMLGRGSPSGAWGDSLEDLRKDLPFLGKDGGPEETAEYSDDYKELQRGLLQPSNQQDPRDSAEYPDWSLLPGSEGGFNVSAAGDSSAASTETLQDPTPQSLDQQQLEALNESTWPSTPGHTAGSSVWSPSVTALPAGEGMERETLQLQEQPSNSSGKEVLMPSPSLPPTSPESSPAMVEKSSNLTVTPWNTDRSTPTFPISTVVPGLTPPARPVSPTTSSRTVKALAVSAGDNLVITLPDSEAELKASVEPAPPADTTYSYKWSLMSHPVDFQGKIKQENKSTLHLSQLSVGLYAFRIAVSSENAFGEGFVNVTVMPAARVNQPPMAVVSPQIQELTVPLTSALIDGNQSTDDTKIVSYHWEEVDGPFLGEVFLADAPTLRLSNLDPGNYTFRLTVTDSDGVTNSTTATLIVHGAVDYPPVANAGPNQTITLPQNTITLNGNQSSDDHQIVLYEWSPGPGGESQEVVMQGAHTPYLHLSELREGEYTFQLMVTDSTGQQSTALVAVIVQAENNQAPVAVAGPDKELFFPVQSATLDGSGSTDDHGIVCYHWEHLRGPSAVEMENVDKAIATVTGLQVGTYHFQLTVRDQQGLSSTSSLTVAVKKDPKKDGLVELILQVGVEQLTEQQKETLVRQLAVLLNVLDSDVKVLKIQAHTDISTVIVFYVQSGPPFKVFRAADVARNLHRRLSKEKAAFLLFKVLRIDTAACLLKCSGHGHCDPITKRCICSQLWMENLIQHYMWDGESNCEWSVFYVAALTLTLTVLTGAVTWLCICCCRRRKRTKIRKKTKYTILDNMDEQERTELRPKYGIKHRSTEHNSSLMVSESEFESDQDTLFSQERMERGILKGSLNGSARNGASFGYCSKDR